MALFGRTTSNSSSTSLSTLQCTLLREMNSEWSELEVSSTVVIFQTSIMIRDAASCSLIADFPVDSIAKLVLINNQLLRITTHHGSKFALRLSPQDMQKFTQELRNNNYPHIHVQSCQPNLSSLPQFAPFPTAQDPALHELIVTLLFKREFQTFVGEVEKVLDSLDSGLSAAKGK